MMGIYEIASAWLDSMRATGRTTKMMKYIITCALNAPHRYFVIGANAAHTSWLARHFLKVLSDYNRNVAVVHYAYNHIGLTYIFGRGEVRFMSETDYNDGRRALGIRDHHQNIRIDDHYTIECRVRDDLKELDRWT